MHFMKSLIGTGGREMRVARKGEEKRVKEVGSRIIRRMVARRFEGAIERDERRRRWRIEEKIFSSKNIPFFLSERLRNLTVLDDRERFECSKSYCLVLIIFSL